MTGLSSGICLRMGTLEAFQNYIAKIQIDQKQDYSDFPSKRLRLRLITIASSLGVA